MPAAKRNSMKRNVLILNETKHSNLLQVKLIIIFS